MGTRGLARNTTNSKRCPKDYLVKIIHRGVYFMLECNISKHEKMTFGNINGEINGYECEECGHKIT